MKCATVNRRDRPARAASGRVPDAAESAATGPQDASDFGRCRRLLDLFPDWESNLHVVSEAFPATPWPSLVDRWKDLTSAHGSADFQPLLDSLIH
jgi:hypothetical protein